jgi:hypothetical protein
VPRTASRYSNYPFWDRVMSVLVFVTWISAKAWFVVPIEKEPLNFLQRRFVRAMKSAFVGLNIANPESPAALQRPVMKIT